MKQNLSCLQTKIFVAFAAVLSVLAWAQQGKFDRNFRVLLAHSPEIARNSAKLRKVSSATLKAAPAKNARVLYPCVIHTEDAQSLRSRGIQVQSVYPHFVTALVSIDDLPTLRDMPQVSAVRAPRVRKALNDISVGLSGASLLNAGVLNNTKYKGTGVIVGIFDGGIDFRHPDFRNPSDSTKSRIARIWDQTLAPTNTEASPAGFSYGVEYTNDQINGDLSGATTGFVREKDISEGHGTHVAGTAAGNGNALPTKKYAGMAPEATYVIVKGGDGSFNDSNIIDALTYFDKVAKQMNMPVVVNMSLGGQYSAHDGTGEEEQAVDAFSKSAPGRAVCIAAGNENGTNVHNSVTIAPGASASVTFTIGADTSASDYFEYLIYSNGSGSLDAVFTDPNNNQVPLANNTDTGNSGVNINSNSFTVYGDNYIDQNNKNRFIDLYLQRYADSTGKASTTDAQGTYTLKITNTGSSTVTMDGWKVYTNDNATVTLTGGDSNKLVGSPGDAATAITVAAYDGSMSFYSNNTGTKTSGGYYYSGNVDGIAAFSSHGPLRDGVTVKPDISAVGAEVISCLARGILTSADTGNADGKYYQIMQGTSMATPAVTGASALLFQVKPGATYLDVKNALMQNTQKDAATTSTPAGVIWGAGKLDVFQAASSLLGSNVKREMDTNETIPYAMSSKNWAAVSTPYVAESFTSANTGILGGLYVYIGNTFTGVTAFTVSLYTSVNGAPGTLVSSLNIDPAAVGKYAANYFDVSAMQASVTAGTPYFIVLKAVGSWSLFFQKNNTSSLAKNSTDGVTWTNAANLYRIRGIVYTAPSATLASQEAVDKDEIAVYPNPAIDILHVHLLNAQPSVLKIFNMAGQLVKEMNTDAQNAQVYVAPLPKGVYLLNIITNGKAVATKKFIKN